MFRQLTLLALACWIPVSARAAEVGGAVEFRKDVRPILQEYCFDCHADGANKGNVAFDEFKSDEALLGNHELWWKAIKNLRADLMPPSKKPQPTAGQKELIACWIKTSVFAAGPQNPDPGRVTLRRLNRVEYRNTIRDLMGFDFDTDVEFPADDTGYGFDNIGDVLTVSPMLLEKYIAAANTIVAKSVPTVSRVIPERVIAGNRFRAADGPAPDGGRGRGNNRMLSLPYNVPASVATSFQAEHPGNYRLIVELAVKGDFDFDPAKCRVSFKADDRELLGQEFGWHDTKSFHYEFDQPWQPGAHSMSFDLKPLSPPGDGTNTLQFRIVSVTVSGPVEQQYWNKPPNYERFFTRDVPESPAGRRQYARELLGSFAKNAFRRPVDSNTVERLVKLAEVAYSQPGKTFETGIAYATAAVLASPRFLFRIEEAAPDTPRESPFANVDEYSLASRLSYFLWSTMPDAGLFRLAERGELRKNLQTQVKRMLDDPRSEALVENFTGQWLQTRDVDGIAINARDVLARDSGQERELKRQLEEFRTRQARRNAQTNALAHTNAPGQTNQVAQADAQRRLNRQRFRPRVELDTELRSAMKRETQMAFSAVVHEDRSVTELIDSDYTFLNQKLAGFYGLTNLDVTGSEMRRVTLPADSPRGGVLTHGSVLVVTSNPDRTSPVKRGLFLLENVLGTPSPPPPANVPALEVAEKEFQDHDPTLRQSLAAHRDKPLCSSCHSRMDPLGLAFENFNAMGMWREKERNQPIDAAGKLITGESFNTVRELKHILANERRNNFYRCLTEKLLTYALGRGLEYYDTETVDQIVQRLDQGNGRFLPLLTGIIESAPFQKQRLQPNSITAEAAAPLAHPGEIKQFAENQTPP